MGDASAEKFDIADKRFMARAIALARMAEGETAPNPVVGCVIVKNGEIVGEGFHSRAGGRHAEIEAIKAAGDAAAGAHLYVTLEPCNHHGRTPPCTRAIVDAGVGAVTYAMADPNPAASGGADALRAAGLATREARDFHAEAAEMNRFWLSRVARDKPYVIGKMAMSLDGRIATRAGDSQWITGAEARADAHRLRRRVDAILVGADTVIADDPALSAREGDAIVARPLRVVLDSAARTSPGAAVYDRAGRGALLLTTEKAPAARRAAFREHGVDIAVLGTDENGRPDAAAAVASLYARGVNGVLVEGGAALHASFLAQGLYDEIHAYLAPILMGGDARPAVDGMALDQLANAVCGAFDAPERLGEDLRLTARLSEFSLNFSGGG